MNHLNMKHFKIVINSILLICRNPNIGSEEGLLPEDSELEWPKYTIDTRMYKELTPDMKNIVDPLGSRCQVWNDFLPKLDIALGNDDFETFRTRRVLP